MSEAVGKNGMPTYSSPVKILRPGDAGFPGSPSNPVTVRAEKEPAVTSSCVTRKSRRCALCAKEFTPTGNRQVRCAACKSKIKPPTKPEAKPAAPQASVVAQAIGKLREKAAMPKKATPELPPELPPVGSAFALQVGGDHYRTMAIQPLEFISKNKLGFIAGNVVKYVCRHHLKGGQEDLDKAIHYLQLLRETEYGKATG